MYTKNYQVEYFMCNQKGDMKPNYLFHMLSDIMGRNAASYGADFEYHLKQNLVWVLVNYEVKIHLIPKAGETITVGTLPYSFKRMYGYRVYEVRDKDNQLMVEGKGKFVLLNYKSKSLAVPDQSLLEKFTDAHKEPIALDFEKVRPSKKTLVYTVNTIVNQSYIDINNHVNNAVYVSLAYDFSPQGFIEMNHVDKMYVQYKKEAFLGETLTLQYYQDKLWLLVSILCEENSVAEVIFKLHPKSKLQLSD